MASGISISQSFFNGKHCKLANYLNYRLTHANYVQDRDDAIFFVSFYLFYLDF